jgi:hypothetical protein
MKLSCLLLSSVIGLLALTVPEGARAQSASGNTRTLLPMPGTVGRSLVPPRPAGLGGNLPPGRGGPNPSVTRRASSAREEAMGLLAVCGPGGALSAQNAAANPGRARARALVCPG